MQENEFEKQIQQKMQELQFTPSDKVWKGVERSFGKNKRRRRFLWLPLMLLALMLGGYFYFKREQSSSVSKEKAVAVPDTNKNNEAVINGATEIDDNETDETVSNDAVDGKVPDSKPSEVITFKEIEEKRKLGESNISKHFISADTSKSYIKESITKTADDVKTKPPVMNDYNKKLITDTAIQHYDKKIIDSTVQDSLIFVQNELQQNKLSDSSFINNKKSKWIIGINAAYGISSASNNLVLKTRRSPAYYSNDPQGGAGANNVILPETSSGSGFQLGISLYNELSGKFSLSSGIDYSLYSTALRTGNRVADSVLDEAAESFLPGSSIKHHNRYHILQIPLHVHYEFNKNTKVPFTLSAGLYVQQIISNNILVFDTSGIYYRDNSLLRRTQFGLSTGFNVALFNQSKTPLLLGPELSFNLSKLNKSYVDNPQRLSFFGIKATLLINKKK